MLELRLSEHAEKLRSDFRSWLRSNPAPQLSLHCPLEQFVDVSREWQRRLAAERFVGVHFPMEYGGRGLTLLEEAVIQEELAKARSPQLVGIFGLTMVGPVLLRHGSEAQKKEYVARILSAEDLWCQGFSEPQAGSDLASLRTSAVREDGGWVISGQKIWTSYAQFASYCFLLARSDSSLPKHKGLTYFLVPMSAPGITVRPLLQITEEAEFNEVFFDATPTAPSSVVGEEGEGWEIAISTLMYERVVLTFARHLQSEVALRELRESFAEPSTDAVIRYASLRARSEAVRALALAHLSTYRDKTPGPEGSLDKLFWSETFQEICALGLELTSEPDRAKWEHRYLYSRGRTIAAGSSEIQRGIIAERLLQLPRK